MGISRLRDWGPVACVLLLAPGAFASAAADTAPQGLRPARPTPVVVVIFDELPLVSLLDGSDSIDARLFPSFSRLAAASTWYRNATTVASFTHDAIPSLLTGRYPTRNGLPFPSLGSNLFTLLDRTHRVSAPVSLPGLCNQRDCREGIGRVGRVSPGVRLFASESRGDPLARFEDHLEGDRPCLCILHLIVPHSPWRYLPTGQRYPGTKPLPGQAEMPGPGRTWIRDGWLVEQAYQRHLLQLGYADVLLGEVLAQVDRAGLADDALLVVAADHGIAFDAGKPKRDPRRSTAGQIASVPLFVKMPGSSTGVVDDRPAELIDVVPTIADFLGMGTRDVGWDGSSLRRERVSPERFLGGVRIEADGSDRRSALDRKLESFGNVSSWGDVLRLAPRGTESYLGTPVPLPGTSPVAGAEIDNLAEIAMADGTESEVPILIKGTVETATEKQILGIAIDGYFAGITRTYRSLSGEASFYVLVPPSSLAGAPHQISLWALDGEAWLPVEVTPSS